jgi:hypothetical protein
MAKKLGNYSTVFLLTIVSVVAVSGTAILFHDPADRDLTEPIIIQWVVSFVIVLGLWVQSNLIRYLAAFFMVFWAGTLIWAAPPGSVPLINRPVNIIVLVPYYFSVTLNLLTGGILLLSKKFGTEFAYERERQPKYKSYLRWLVASAAVVAVLIVTVNTIALSVTNTFAQIELPANAGSLFLDTFKPATRGCFSYALGKVQLMAGANERPAPTSNFGRDLLALEKLGVIRIDATDVRNTFNVVLTAQPDDKTITLMKEPGNKDAFCIKVYDYSGARVEFTKVEHTSGGGSRWIVAYGFIRGKKFNPLYKKFNVLRMAMGHGKQGQPRESGPDPYFRILFQQDTKDRKWRLVTYDGLRYNQFIEQSVPQVLAAHRGLRGLLLPSELSPFAGLY